MSKQSMKQVTKPGIDVSAKRVGIAKYLCLLTETHKVNFDDCAKFSQRFSCLVT